MAVTDREPTTDRPVYDLLAPSFYAGDQRATYRWMRANEPVYHDEKNAMWGITATTTSTRSSAAATSS